MLNIEEKIKSFKAKYRSECFALVSWSRLKSKDYPLNEMLSCICEVADGSLQKMQDIVLHLTAKRKVFGRTQVYAPNETPMMDIRRDEDGNLKLFGYENKEELPLKGQHKADNPKIFRKKDSQTNKLFKNADERMHNLGQKVRELFPNEDNHYITFAMQAIRKFAEEKKIHTDKVINGLKSGKYVFDSDNGVIVSNMGESKERHTIFVNESDMYRISAMYEMTPYKFQQNMKHFISQLLQDPVNTQVPDIFALHNFTRSHLLNYLLSGKNPVLIRKQTICDKDENGEPKTATMKVEFKCPKKDFDRKLEKLYIRMFEKNLPPRKKHESEEEEEVDEATGCGGSGAAGGAFVAPAFSIQRRKMPTEIGESTTTFNTGKYTYDAPVLGDEETLARHDGVDGSVSVNYEE